MRSHNDTETEDSCGNDYEKDDPYECNGREENEVNIENEDNL